MHLSPSLVREYCLVRPVSRGHAYLLRRTCTLFGCERKHTATLDDLNDRAVSAFVAWLEPLYTPSTVAGHRVRILGLWRFAARRYGIDGPGEVRRAPVPQPMPRAWTLDELRRLLAAAADMPEGGDWFRAAILVAYESGLRKSDLAELHRDQVARGLIQFRQHKTAWPHVIRLSKRTVVAVLGLPGPYPLTVPWGSKKYTRLWHELRSRAGVQDGAFQRIRRTGASYVARDHGLDAARQWLGHRSPDMVRHYVDRRIAKPKIYKPPDVGRGLIGSRAGS